MQFFMLYAMVMPKMPKYALKRSFLNVFLLIFRSYDFVHMFQKKHLFMNGFGCSFTWYLALVRLYMNFVRLKTFLCFFYIFCFCSYSLLLWALQPNQFIVWVTGGFALGIRSKAQGIQISGKKFSLYINLNVLFVQIPFIFDCIFFADMGAGHFFR